MGENTYDIRENSQIKWILQLDDNFSQLKDFNFNGSEMESVKSLRFAEVFVKWGKDNCFVAKIDPSPFEKMLCSTDFESLKTFSDDISMEKIIEQSKKELVHA